MSDLPPGWEWSTLDNLSAAEPRAITDGPFGSNLKSNHYTTSGARVIRLQNIGDGEFRDEWAYIDLDRFEQLRSHEVRKGDLLVASLGDAPPRACIAPELGGPAIVKADCIRVRTSSHILPQWVLYALLAPPTKTHAKALIKGVGRPRLGLGQIRALPIPVPPADEQRRIVGCLSEILAGVNARDTDLRRAIGRASAMTSAVLRDAIPMSWPADWKRATVADAGRVDLGRQRHPDWHHGPNMRPYLRVANVFEDRLDLRDVMEMHFTSTEFDRFRLAAGDILLNEGQSPEYLGRPAMYRGDPAGMAFTNSLLRFRAGPEVLPEWALLVFRHHMRAGRFMREVRITTNIAHLSASRFKAVEFPVPSVPEQERLVDQVKERLADAARLMDAARLAQARGAALRRSVLADAFAGRLVPQDSSDEPASALLARIRAERAAQPVSGRRGVRRASR